MTKVRKQCRSQGLPDWRRLVLGLFAVFLMCAQGTAATAHTHSHDELAELAHSSHIAPISSDSPGPVKTNPVNSCPLCHSSLGASPLLPLSAVSFMAPPVLRGVAAADFDRRPPGSPPSGVWHVRGPPSFLHI